MRVVFLDIDGVLNSHGWFQQDGRGTTRVGNLDPTAAARVQRLCDEADARIVISSTWRLYHNVPELTGFFAQRGLTVPIIGMTPEIENNKGRGEEIQEWLESAHAETLDLEGFVILDDEEEMLHLTPWLVRTSFITGITDAHVEKAKAILQKRMPKRR